MPRCHAEAALQGQAALLRVVPTWMLRIAFPRPLDLVYDAYQRVIHDELEAPTSVEGASSRLKGHPLM